MAVEVLTRRGLIGRAAMLTASAAHNAGLLAGAALPLAGAALATDLERENLDHHDLERNVYCVLGLPIDALDMPATLRQIDAAAASQKAFLLSTPNFDYLVQSRSDPEFRESLLDSDLCPADGMPIVWIARLIGVPVKERVSGADIFDALKAPGRRLKLFLFGGADGVAEAAAKSLDSIPAGGMSCVGTHNPGFVAVDAMSGADTIDQLNASGADFLAVALGAKKGQLWLHRNHSRLTIPVRAHLGAAFNFQAGQVRRAPPKFRAWGLEWLWRIKEEPYLWRRYWHDGSVLLRLFVTRVLPLVIVNRRNRLRSERHPRDLLLNTAKSHGIVMIGLNGDAIGRHADKAIAGFRDILAERYKAVVIDLSSTHAIDQRFFGLLLMLRKRLKGQGTTLTFIGASAAMKRMFRLNELDFLLNGEQSKEPHDGQDHKAQVFGTAIS